MTGSLQEKRGIYQCVLNFKDKEGKRRQKWISTGLPIKGNKRKAIEMLNRLLLEYESNMQNTNCNDVLFVEYLKNWLKNKKNKVEITTWEGYYNTVVNHFIPYFKPLNLMIREIKPKHIVDYYDYKFSPEKGGGLSLGTIKKHSAVLRNILNQAYLEEIIDRNPSLKVPLPKKDNEEPKGKFLTSKQANDLLKIFRGHPLQPIIYMTLYYGLRRGEVLGLKWSAIDFENNTIKINHTVTQTLTLVAKDKTKTATSKREYYLLPEIKELLLNLRTEQRKNQKLFGNEYKMNDYIFTWEDGRPYRPDYVSKAFHKVLTKNNFPEMRFHDLRHSCASILYDKKWELKDIQTWLGHADIQTTANIYTHISNSRKNNMAKDIQNTFLL